MEYKGTLPSDIASAFNALNNFTAKMILTANWVQMMQQIFIS